MMEFDVVPIVARTIKFLNKSRFDEAMNYCVF